MRHYARRSPYAEFARKHDIPSFVLGAALILGSVYVLYCMLALAVREDCKRPAPAKHSIATSIILGHACATNSMYSVTNYTLRP